MCVEVSQGKFPYQTKTEFQLRTNQLQGEGCCPESGVVTCLIDWHFYCQWLTEWFSSSGYFGVSKSSLTRVLVMTLPLLWGTYIHTTRNKEKRKSRPKKYNDSAPVTPPPRPPAYPAAFPARTFLNARHCVLWMFLTRYYYCTHHCSTRSGIPPTGIGFFLSSFFSAFFQSVRQLSYFEVFVFTLLFTFFSQTVSVFFFFFLHYYVRADIVWFLFRLPSKKLNAQRTLLLVLTTLTI